MIEKRELCFDKTPFDRRRECLKPAAPQTPVLIQRDGAAGLLLNRGLVHVPSLQRSRLLRTTYPLNQANSTWTAIELMMRRLAQFHLLQIVDRRAVHDLAVRIEAR